LGRPWSTNDASRYESQKPEQQESGTQFFFKHQYITNPTVLPKSLVVAAAQQLTSTLKGNIPAGNETAEALKKVSELFTKVAEAKANVAKAKEQQNRIRTHPMHAVPYHFQGWPSKTQGWNFQFQGWIKHPRRIVM
jgi:hypothetical protein